MQSIVKKTYTQIVVFSMIPIVIEFTLIAIILLSEYTWIFAVTVFATAIVYIFFTLLMSDWQMDYRHNMNRLDSAANTVAFDSLINYETVKYFNNESA